MQTVALALAPGGLIAQAQGKTVLIWRGETATRPMRLLTNGYGTNISVLNWSDSTVLLAGSVNGEVLAWHVEQGTVLLANRLSSHMGAILEISCSPCGL